MTPAATCSMSVYRFWVLGAFIFGWASAMLPRLFSWMDQWAERRVARASIPTEPEAAEQKSDGEDHHASICLLYQEDPEGWRVELYDGYDFYPLKSFPHDEMETADLFGRATAYSVGIPFADDSAETRPHQPGVEEVTP